jgi:hypothetical protein
VTEAVEHLPIKLEALNSNSSIAKKKERKRGREGGIIEGEESGDIF